MNNEIIKFDPTIEVLNAIVEKSRKIDKIDLEDKQQIELVKQTRLSIGKARISIEKIGKELRSGALAFQKAVIVKEKELLDIINPEENRLKQIEKDAEILEIKKDRLIQIPIRKERLIKHEIQISEDVLLELDDIKFESMFYQLIAEKQEKIQADIERQRLEIENEKQRLIQIEKDAENKIKADMETKARIEKGKDALRKQQEQEKLDNDTRYQEFINKHDYDKVETVNGEIILWKKIATLKLNK